MLKGKILVQYSGGKDSTACIIKLLEEGAYIEAVHFVHKYGYTLPTIEAKRICNEYGVKLYIIDITEQIEALFLSGFSGRPCRFCKGVMDSETVKLAVQNNFDYICVGDTYSDTALVERRKTDDRGNLVINRYFNKAVELPDNIFIIRPLITFNNNEVIDYLDKHSIKIKRNNDTGDKYFEYSREGCPLQFKDFGVMYSKELMEKLKKTNILCSEFATKNGIKASIHMPSEMIVTLPKGYEELCKHYLMDRCIELKKKYRIKSIYKRYFFSVEIYPDLLDENNIINLFSRFMERLLEIRKITHMDNDKLFMSSDYAEINARLLKKELKIVGDYCSLKYVEQAKLENLFLELFHTYNFNIFYVDDWIQIEDSNILQSVTNCRYISANKSYGRILRSGAIDNINDDDITYLANNEIFTAIDIRNRKKCSEDLIQRLTTKGIKYIRVPFAINNYHDCKRNYSLYEKIDSYMKMISSECTNVRGIFDTIAENDGGVLIFCKNGRDRTGIISIILSLLANKSRAGIVLDYVVSDLFLNIEKNESQVYEYSSNVPVEFIIRFLEKYKSAYNYLSHIGVSDKNINKLIEKIGK